MQDVGNRVPAALDVPPLEGTEAAGAGSLVKRIVVLAIVVALLAAGAMYGVKTVLFYAEHVTTDDAQIEGHINPVLPRVAGYVSEVNVTDNRRVAAGDVLVRIDARDFESRVVQAQAALDNTRAAVLVAKARVEAVRSKSAKSVEDLARANALHGQKVVSSQERDNARWAANIAAAELEAATREVAVAEAMIVQRQADLDYAKLQLSYTTLTAPVSGTISKKAIEVGQFVQPGQPLMAIVGDQEVWVVANFKETQLSDVRIGQTVDVHVDAYPQKTFTGRVESIAAATGSKFALLPPDNATGNFVKVVQRVPVKVLFVDPPDATHPLRIGMDVSAVVHLQ